MRSLRLILLTCAVSSLPAVAQGHALRIPAMPLSDAINLLSEQTDTVIIAQSGDLPTTEIAPVIGDLTIPDALAALLTGTHLSYRSDVKNVWVIKPVQADNSATALPLKPSRAAQSLKDSLRAIEPQRTYETIIVTGSRAGLSAYRSMSPIEVLDQTELSAPISDDLSDVLAEILPSFFVQRRPLSDGSVFVRPYSLRNLSADHTLIMVNGKRRHRSAMLNTGGSQASDLSKIPTNALQRVEVLRDGASAQYGSDAIAGVINIITRQDTTPEASAQYSQYYEGDGIQKRIGLGGGIGWFEGGIRLDLDYSKAASTSRARQRLDALQYLETYPDADVADPVQKWGQPEREDFRALLTSDHQTVLGEFYSLTNVSRGQGVSDFNWRSPDTVSAYSSSSAFKDWSLRDIYPNGFKPQFGQEDSDISTTLGLKSSTDVSLSYDFSAGFGENRIDYFLYDTINASMGPESPTSFDTGGLRQQAYDLNADFQTELTPRRVFSKPLNLAFGLEHRLERYTINAGTPASYEVGPGAVDGLTSGSNGFPGYTQSQARSYDQSSRAAYGDTQVRLGETSQLGAALRFENFDTFGSRLSGKISISHDLNNMLMLRTTASTGFKAPTPAQLYSERTSQGVAPDTLDVFTNGRFSPTGPVAQIINNLTDMTIEPLRPETSGNLSAGLVLRAMEGFVASMDIYSIEVCDRIFISESYTLNAAERARLAALGVPGGESITRVEFYQNSFDTRTSGIDFVLDYDRRLAGGDLHLDLSYNYNSTDVLSEHFIDNPSRARRFERLYPRYSGSASARYILGGMTLDTRLRWVGPWADYANQSETLVQEFGSELFLDANISMSLREQTILSIGAENLFNAYPDEATLEASKGLIYSRNAPYDTDGGLYYIRISTRL